MNDFNKITVRYGIIMLVLALIVFTTIMVVAGYIKSGFFWPAIIPPVVAIVYGCIAFFKKYKPNDKY